MSQPKQRSIGRKVLVWSLILIMWPFGFTMDKPFKTMDAFLPG